MTASPGWIRRKACRPGTSFQVRPPTARASSRAIRADHSRRRDSPRHGRDPGALARRPVDRSCATESGATASLLRRPLVTAPQENPSSIENYLRVTALLYLFIGLFIFVRRWNAPRAIHFYVFCLVSFILYSFHYTGKLNSFDWTIYWGNVVALLLQPALLVHFALVFPERRGALWPKLAAVYSVPRPLCCSLHVFVATGTLDFLPSIGSAHLLDQVELPIWASISCSPRRFSWRAICARPAAFCGSS